MKIKISLFISFLLLTSQMAIAQKSKKQSDGIAAWNLQMGYEWGDYKITGIDEGDYVGLTGATQIGLNTRRFFLGAELRGSYPAFVSENEAGLVDRELHPLPEREHFAWGPTLALKFGDIHLYGVYYPLETLKYKQPKVDDTDQRSFFYKYTGTGFRAGLALHLGGDSFVTYDYHEASFGEYQQKIDGIYSDVSQRRPLQIQSHTISLRFPVNPFFLAEILNLTRK